MLSDDEKGILLFKAVIVLDDIRMGELSKHCSFALSSLTLFGCQINEVDSLNYEKVSVSRSVHEISLPLTSAAQDLHGGVPMAFHDCQVSNNTKLTCKPDARHNDRNSKMTARKN
eukprot:RCo038908